MKTENIDIDSLLDALGSGIFCARSLVEENLQLVRSWNSDTKTKKNMAKRLAENTRRLHILLQWYETFECIKKNDEDIVMMPIVAGDGDEKDA